MDLIDIDKIILYILFVLIMAMSVYIYYNDPFNNTKCPITNVYKEEPVNNNVIVQENANQNTNQNTKNINIDINKQNDNVSQIPTIGDIMRDYDYRALTDPLVPPYKRDDFTIPLPSFPTRGYPTAFKKVGYLVDKDADNNDKYKFMLLMGRQKYPGGNYYNYYVTENNTDSALKFDLHHRHNEILSGDHVELKELNKKYTAKIDKTLGYEYYPFYY
jgi:hypothetical protein